MLRILVPALGLALLYYVWRHPDGWAGLAKLLRPLLYLGAALLYLRSPIDLIPDTTPIGFIDDLLVLLAAIYYGRPVSGPGAEPGAEDDGHRRSQARGKRQPRFREIDPHDVLGVGRGASAEEITRAFRDKMKQYHPDRVAGLGEELQKVAHEKSVEIRRAYDALRKK